MSEVSEALTIYNNKELTDESIQIIELSIIKFQSLVRLFITRSKILKDINKRYEKIFDPNRQQYYYYDTLTDATSWVKPALLLHCDIEKVSSLFTEEQAVVLIQTRIRMFLALKCVRLQYQSIIQGKYYLRRFY